MTPAAAMDRTLRVGREQYALRYLLDRYELLDAPTEDVAGVPIRGEPVVVGATGGRLVSSSTPFEQESGEGLRTEEVRRFELRLGFEMRRPGASVDEPTTVDASQQVRNASTGEVYEVVGTDADRTARMYLSVWVVLVK